MFIVSHHRYAVQGFPGALFVRGHHRPVGRILHVRNGLAGGFAGSDDHRGDHGDLPPGDFSLLHHQDPVAEADHRNENELQQGADDVIGQRHPGIVFRRHDQPGADHLDRSGHRVGGKNTVHVVDAGKLPHAAVEAEQREHQDRQHRIIGREALKRGQIEILGHVAHGVVHIKA